MGFYRDLPNDRPRTWFEEFRAEVVSDHRQLTERRDRQSQNPSAQTWSFDNALKRTREFYYERFTGYQRVGSISEGELGQLLSMVDALGTPDFPPR